MTPYNTEQYDAYTRVVEIFSGVSSSEKERLAADMESYLAFRQTVSRFFETYFSRICTHKCYTSQLSACCSKEGIITFFADIVINVLSSTGDDIQHILSALKAPHTGHKCVYLGEHGCLWRIKPIVCEMFLCDTAKDEVFASQPAAQDEWQTLKEYEKRFKWPDRPVLFDTIEAFFIEKGGASTLMYFHNSPGLLRIKRRAGLI